MEEIRAVALLPGHQGAFNKHSSDTNISFLRLKLVKLSKSSMEKIVSPKNIQGTILMKANTFFLFL